MYDNVTDRNSDEEIGNDSEDLDAFIYYDNHNIGNNLWRGYKEMKSD